VPSISYLDILVVVYVCQDIFLRDIVNYPPFNLWKLLNILFFYLRKYVLL